MSTIDIRHLQELAERTTGEAQLGELVRRLIYATVARCQPKLHFLAGESNGYPGWDGWVDVSFEQTGQPRLHRSVWELSTNKRFEAKFKSDYKAAMSKSLPNGWSKSEVIYVGLTLRSVTPPRLAKIKQKLIKEFGFPWAGVVLLAADDLVQWLEKVPSVEDWAAEEFKIGTGRYGRSLGHWFSSWSRQTNPIVSEELLVCGRDLTNLRSSFRLDSDPITRLQCDSVEEATALVYCAAKSLPESDAQLVLSSTLVVDDESKADRLVNQQLATEVMPTVVLVPPATRHSNRFKQAGFRVFHALGRNDDSSVVLQFERPSVSEFSAVLTTSMGVESARSDAEARACGCSVSIWHIRNLYGHGIQPTLPEWVGSTSIDAVIAAVFVGTWHEQSKPDMLVMSCLSGMSDEQLSSLLAPYAICVTPLLEHIGSDRLVIAPTAAFEFIRRRINRHHIERLRVACNKVFSTISPLVEDRWHSASPELRMRNGREEISDGLRDGLAETLLRIAVLGDPLVKSGALDGFSSAQSFVDQFVDHLVRALPGLNSDTRVLASLDRQLPDLIEAAPIPFLDALDALIQGYPDQLRLLLADESGIFGKSFHTGLLWGLEGLAWSSDFLPRVAQTLAALSEIDPGGQLSNRPFRSLTSLFLAWYPGTSVSPTNRAAIIRSIADRFPKIGWRLIVDLLPGRRRTASQTHCPKWRSLGQVRRRSILRSEVISAYELIVDIALQFAGADAEKLRDLVDGYPNLSSGHKERLESALRQAGQTACLPEAVQRLRAKLYRLANHHRSFANADWALPSAEVDRLVEIADALELPDPVLRHRWLFDDQFPDLGIRGEDHSEQVAELQRRRKSAVDEIIQVKGWAGVDHLVSTAQFSYIVGDVVGALSCEDTEILRLLNTWQARGGDADWLAFRSVSSSRLTLRGQEWSDVILDFSRDNAWSARATAMAFVDYPNKSETYDLIGRLSQDVQHEYWTRRFGYVRGADSDLKAFKAAVDGFLAHGRAIDLIDQNWGDLHLLGYERVLNVVDAFIEKLSDGEGIHSYSSLDHDTQHVFEWLRRQPESDHSEIAKREYAILPLLRRYDDRGSELALHRLLREQPKFFADIVCDLYKPASGSEESIEKNEEVSRGRAHTAFELLDSWVTPPGVVGGSIDEQALFAWMTEARAQLLARDRVVIGDQQIGKVLYHLPKDSDEGIFPPLALRNLLEHFKSPEIERGIEMESINSRGVTSRALYEGGRQERELERIWRSYASQIGPKWPRSVALCQRVADSWRHDAEAEDMAAKRDRARESR